MSKLNTLFLVTILLYVIIFSGIACGEAEASIDKNSFELAGFVDMRVGARTENDPLQKDGSISELRLQFEAEKEISDFTLNIVFDFLLDPVADVYVPNYDTGEGVIDPRQFNILFSVLNNVDVKIGRQILTWGTGDLIFINDLFPKDFRSFFIGRDDEYLKTPSDAIKFSVFFNSINIDVAYIPKFNADRFVDGSRISYYDRFSESFRGRANKRTVDRPDDWFEDDELAMRLYQSFSGVETALYYYNGFWKSPAAINTSAGSVSFPVLQVLGASLRFALALGIANLEFGVYKSEKNAKSNPLSRNSEFRLILGFEKEIASEFTVGIQYSLERKLDYDRYLASLPDNVSVDDRNRSVMTLRLTKLMFRQDIKWSLFNFYSASDGDGYLRMNAYYKLSDDLKVEGGINHFYGEKSHTLFSQFKNAGNVYTAIRYEF